MATIVVGSLPGVWIGTALLPHVPVAGLRHALGIIVAAAALGVLSRAGVSLPPIVLAGIPALLAVASVAVHRGRSARGQAAERKRIDEQRRHVDGKDEWEPLAEADGRDPLGDTRAPPARRAGRTDQAE